MSETQNGSTALVSDEIHAAVERAMSDVQTFIDSEAAREKMVWMLAMQVNENLYLQKCTPKSFELAIYQMFKLNLDPRNKNEAWLIPRKEDGVWKANFQVGYAGARKLALNDARVDDIFAEIVYENDTYDTDPHTRAPLHRYHHFGARGPVIGYYGAIRYKNGMWHTEEMSVADMRAWKDHYSAAKDKAVWKENRGVDGLKRCPFDAMALKTMITAMCSTRHANLSPEAHAAVRTDAELYIGERDVTPASTYVPTHEEHVQNGNDVFGEPTAPTQEHYTPPPKPYEKGLGLTSKKLAEEPGGPLAPVAEGMSNALDEQPVTAQAPTLPIQSVEQLRRKAGVFVKAAAATCGATSGDIWENVKALAPQKFQLQRQQDLDTVESLLPRAVALWEEAHPAPALKENDSAPPVLPLTAWLVDMAARHGGTIEDIQACLVTHDLDDLFGQAAGLDPLLELPDCLEKLEAILEKAALTENA